MIFAIILGIASGSLRCLRIVSGLSTMAVLLAHIFLQIVLIIAGTIMLKYCWRMDTILLDEDMINTKHRFGRAFVISLPFMLFRMILQICIFIQFSRTVYILPVWVFFILLATIDITPVVAVVFAFRIQGYSAKPRVFLKPLEIYKDEQLLLNKTEQDN